jgi:hypothetical protein
MKNSARSARVAVSADGRGLVSQAGAVLLWETMRVTGLGRGLSAALQQWRAPLARLGLAWPVAEAVADRVDWHDVARLVQRGCPAALAVTILD